MNKKAQSVIFIFFVLLIVFLVWVTGLSGWIQQVGHDMVVANSLTGLDAWFYSNINLLIGFVFFVAFAAMGRYGWG